MTEDIDKVISGKYCNRFGVIAVDKGFVTADQLKVALTEQADDKVQKVIETVRKVAVTEQGGDGRIYVSTLDESIHIHAGDTHLGDSSEDEK